MDNLYGSGADGYCGDEDNGQTSAWFVFSSLGFYPVAPVTGQYILGSPLFEQATIKLANGKELLINAHNNSDKNIFINNFAFNKVPSNNNWIDHKNIKEGGVIDFTMSNQPNFNWGSAIESVPYSVTKIR
jgi:putative alpha-1,2-mannosidase